MKRFTGIIIAGQWLMLSGPAWAQGTPPLDHGRPCINGLAAGEMLLTIHGAGLSVSAPDFATLSIVMVATGKDNVAARAANVVLQAKVTGIITAAGIQPAAIQHVSSGAMSAMGVVGNEDFPSDPKDMPRSFATSTMMIRVTDMAKLAVVRTRLQEVTEIRLGNPEYGLIDNSSARRAAIDQALAKARIDAALHAKALNMQIDHIVRVSDDAGGLNAGYIAEMIAARGRVPPDGVQTEARVEVDFILRPL